MIGKGVSVCVINLMKYCSNHFNVCWGGRGGIKMVTVDRISNLREITALSLGYSCSF